jgi:DNA-binding FrmR family transcriptional regulator
MALPTQLQEQVEKAKELAAQYYGEKKTESSETAATDAENTSAEASTETTEAPQPEAAAASTTQEVATSSPNTATPAGEENNDTYAQRWRSLQGVYNAQKRQLDETQHRLQNMEQLVAQMQAAPVAVEQVVLEHVHRSRADGAHAGAQRNDRRAVELPRAVVVPTGHDA